MAWPKKTIVHKRVSRASDGQGGWTDTPTTLTSSLRGSVQPASATEVENAGPQLGYISHVVFFRPGVTIERDDTFTVDSQTMRVKGVLLSTKEKYIKCLCTVEGQAGN